MSDGTLTTLIAHRAAVLEIVDGLSDEQLNTPVVPSGWTVLGLVDHVARAMAFWGDWVIAGRRPDVPWPAAGGQEGPFVADRPVADVVAFYLAAGARLERTLAEFPSDATPLGDVGPMADLATDVGTVAAHLLEEVARHAGHLDIARELLDGRTGLGER